MSQNPWELNEFVEIGFLRKHFDKMASEELASEGSTCWEEEDCEFSHKFQPVGLLLESVKEITKSVRKRNG